MAKNKLAKFADMDTYSHVFQYDFKTLQKGGFPLQGKWHTHFGNDRPIILELGCGKGVHRGPGAYVSGEELHRDRY